MFKIIFKNFKRKDYLMAVVSILLIVLGVYLDLLMPDYMSEMTNAFYTNFEIMDIIIPGLKMLGCALGSGIISVIIGFFVSVMASSLGKNLRRKMFKKVEKMSQHDIDAFSTPSLITRTTNDIVQVQNTLSFGFQVIIRAPIIAVIAIYKVWNHGITGWVLATAIAVCIMVLLLGVIIILCVPKFRKVQKLTDDVNEVSRENLTGLRVIKAFNAEEYQLNKFSKTNNTLTNNNLFTGVVMAFLNPIMNLMMNGLTLAIYWIGAYAIDETIGLENQADLFSRMVVFSSYAMQVVMAFLLLVAIFMILPRALVSARRINEVLDTEIEIKEGSFDQDTEVKGKVKFENVSFSYNDSKEQGKENVLENISFEVNKGQTLAFIGATGSGKTTLLNLIVRFYDPSEGKITIDDVDVKDYKFDTLYNKIGYVSQKSILFQGTIKDNVFYGESSAVEDDENLKQALYVSSAEEFVNSKENKELYEVEQAGKNLSGGQKQRLSIARAVARKPEIIIFDDSFSALDYKTDFEVRDKLSKALPNTTKIIVAQRIGTIKHADQIIVLDEGKIVGKGTHDELIKNCKVYQEIALSQLSKEEL